MIEDSTNAYDTEKPEYNAKILDFGFATYIEPKHEKK
jgi:hypothetical protein